MKNHFDYVTHIDNEEDVVHLRTNHFPVNMRLFNTSKPYREIIEMNCNYVRQMCLSQCEGYKKPHGMSAANLALGFNIIGIAVNRNTAGEYCEILINPVINEYKGDVITSFSNCGSLTLPEPIEISRFSIVNVSFYNEQGQLITKDFDSALCGLSIQHEIDHNNGLLITDRQVN